MTANSHKFIVVGMSVSGAMAVLRLAELGNDVSLFTPFELCRSKCAAVKAGLNAAMGAGDSADLHAAGTLKAGHGLARREGVERMCRSAPSIVGAFERMGVPFDRTSEGRLALHLSQGSNCARTIRAGNAMGIHLMTALTSQLFRMETKGRLKIFERQEFLAPVVDEKGACRGIVARNMRNMEVKAHKADAVVICAGGYAGIFSGSPLYDNEDNGSALVSCVEHGAVFANPEFARAGDVPITLGGLWVDADHMTSVPGLFAAGSSACEYFGADVLDGNELLSAAHGGVFAGERAFAFALSGAFNEAGPSLLEAAVQREEEGKQAVLVREGKENCFAIVGELAELMNKLFSAPRSAESLKNAVSKLAVLDDKLKSAPLFDRSEWANFELSFAQGLEKRLELARIIVEAAGLRKESRGLHRIEGFAETDDKRWRTMTKVSLENGELKFEHINP